MQPSTTKTKMGLRVVSPGEINECLAVDRAQMHAQNKSFTWKQHIRNFDTYLELEMNPDEFAMRADYR